MPLSSITQVLLRLFALSWALTGLVQLAQTAMQAGYYKFSGPMLAAPLIMLLMSSIVWRFAPRISQALVRGNDTAVSLQGVTQSQLYATVFVGLGMYFALDSFADVFNWLHFFAINNSPDYGFHHDNKPSYYDLTKNLLTLIAGITLIFTAHIWAEKLTRQGEKPPSVKTDSQAQSGINSN